MVLKKGSRKRSRPVPAGGARDDVMSREWSLTICSPFCALAVCAAILQIANASSLFSPGDDQHRCGSMAGQAADQSVTDRLFLSGAADHQIWFPQLAIWAISLPRGSGQNAHQPDFDGFEQHYL
jgi:hypothetical protein